MTVHSIGDFAIFPKYFKDGDEDKFTIFVVSEIDMNFYYDKDGARYLKNNTVLHGRTKWGKIKAFSKCLIGRL
jgi:hypothetical protein